FTVERLNASAAVFDRDKLLWMNAQHLSRLPLAEIRPHLEPFLAEVGLGGGALDEARLAAALELHRTRARTLRDLAQAVVPYFAPELAYDPAACAKYADDPAVAEGLAALRERLLALPAWEKEAIEAGLRALAEERGIKAGALIHPARLALSGANAGPPLFDLLEVMGREATARHLERFVGCLRQEFRPAPAG
ncbi:MAG: glutamate--tRNA ligase, partial [Thermoanaerobaculia bacterium]